MSEDVKKKKVFYTVAEFYDEIGGIIIIP